MAEDTEQLKREIEGTRRDLGRDVDALTEKVTPSRVVGRRVDRVKGGFGRFKESVMGKADSAGSTMGGTAGSAMSTVTDTAGSAASTVGDVVSSAPDRARSQTRGTPLAAGLIAFAARRKAATIGALTSDEPHSRMRALLPVQ
jgi:hypothetical protein